MKRLTEDMAILAGALVSKSKRAHGRQRSRVDSRTGYAATSSQLTQAAIGVAELFRENEGLAAYFVMQKGVRGCAGGEEGGCLLMLSVARQ